MSKFFEHSNYMGRSVIAYEGCFSKQNNCESLQNSMVLVCFEKKDSENAGKIFKNLIANNPLGIAVAGKDVDGYFSALLTNLSLSPEEHPHVMTSIFESSKMKNWLHGFFDAFCPSEDRFDAWNKYTVLSIGDKKFTNKLSKKLTKKVSRYMEEV